ncbi:hypothetical protein [Entomobacter blattae]|uniref:Uncharacterized protein n=1 Tax=Entomobacter blattae TaxID=2762277 RepID=A0A7H1NT81_9PROT|nr:hypothetical protein [Entomobacter blattae]QNT78991.1 hypothetical protein JGUZn3_17740 [Entomobacter blattae]
MALNFLTISDSTRQKLINDTDNLTSNFALGYTDLYAEILYQKSAGLGTLAPESTFWYSQVADINADNQQALGSLFIRNATLYGLAWDGKVNVNFQDISDRLARAVISDVVKTGKIYETDYTLQFDIKTALQYGNVTIGGWGGAFYYWTTPYEGTKTVGELVLQDPFQYNKFLATTTDALLKTAAAAIQSLAKTPTFDNLWSAVQQAVPTAIQASAPLNVKADIVGRAFDTLLGGNVAGDPNRIFGYIYLGNNPFDGKSLWLKTLDAYFNTERNISGNDQLDQLRQERISAQTVANDSLISIPSQSHYLSDLTHYIPTNDSHAVLTSSIDPQITATAGTASSSALLANNAIVSTNANQHLSDSGLVA